MTPGADRLLLISSVSTSVLGLGGFAASAAEVLPGHFRPFAVLLCGAACLYLLFRYVTVGRAVLARRIMLSAALVLTLLVAYGVSNRVWPEHFPLGREISTSAKGGTERPAVGATPANLTQGLKVSEPRKLARIGTCAEVVGTGRIPRGFQVWVANLNDHGGKAEVGGLHNLRRATRAEGETDWRAGPFGVGVDSDEGKNFWIYVYLLPDSAGSAIEGMIKPAKDPHWRPSLKTPITGSKVISRIPVQRTAENTCDNR